jgi:hypothetical protein
MIWVVIIALGLGVAVHHGGKMPWRSLIERTLTVTALGFLFLFLVFAFVIGFVRSPRAAEQPPALAPGTVVTIGAAPQTQHAIPYDPPPETEAERAARIERTKQFDACIDGYRVDALGVRHAVYKHTPECKQW